jgi:predicted permease
MLHASLPVIDGRVALVAFALTALSALACGLVPALRVTRIDLQRSIRGDQSVGRAATVRGALVIVQIALSVVVLIAAGLMIRSLRNIQRVDPGFAVDGAVTATVSLSRQGYDRARAADFFERLQERLAASPGVTGVAVGQMLPMSSGGMMASVTASGRDEHSPMNLVAPGYFAGLGVPLLHGRDFNALDRKDSEKVAIVNETLARSFWQTTDVVDRRAVIADVERRIVGVVKTTKYGSLREEAMPMVFVPRAQDPTKTAEIAIRTRGDEATAAVLLRDAIRALDRDVPVHDLQTLRERVGTAWQREEALASVLTIFGALAMVLAAVGLFSVVSYRTETRRKELGIRIAVGASARDILALVVRGDVSLCRDAVRCDDVRARRDGLLRHRPHRGMAAGTPCVTHRRNADVASGVVQ